MDDITEKFGRTFDVDDRVRFNVTDTVTGTGTVLGLAIDYIVKQYIVLLDTPIPGCPYKAILCQNTLMEKLP